MLRVEKKLTKAYFDKPIIGLCYSMDKKQVGYVLKFGDFSLYMNEYMAQVVNVLGTSTKDGVITSKRTLSKKSYKVNEAVERNMLSSLEENTLLVASLSLYLNNTISEFVEVNYNEWDSLEGKYKLLIVYLLGSMQDVSYLISLYRSCSVKEKIELFYFVLSLVGIYKQTLIFMSKESKQLKTFVDIENSVDSSVNITIEQVVENANILGQVITEKSDTVTVVERTMGKFHKSADVKFYESLVEVVNTTPLYRGKTAWKGVLETLRDNPKYSVITYDYLNQSGYKLNTNNLRNWYNYYTKKTLKTEKFKIISENFNISDMISDIDYNRRENNGKP